MQSNLIHHGRTKANHNGWDDWENEVIKQGSGRLTREQITNIIVFLGSNRNAKSITRQANLLGWSLRVKKC